MAMNREDQLFARPKISVWAPDHMLDTPRTFWMDAMLGAIEASPEFVCDANESDIVFCGFETGFESWWPGLCDLEDSRISHTALAKLIASAPEAIRSVALRHPEKQVVVLEAVPVCRYSNLRDAEQLSNLRVCSTAAHVHSFQPGWDISIPMFGLPHVEPQDSERAECRKYIDFSFMGSLSHPVRQVLFELQHHNINMIPQFSELSVSHQASESQAEYINKIKHSWFTLCPRGDEMYTFRFSEALRFGSIPVVLADGWIPPLQEYFPPDTYMVRVAEAEAMSVAEILAGIDLDSRQRMRRAALDFYRAVDSPAALVDAIVRAIACGTLKSARARTHITEWRCSCDSWN